MMSFYHVYQFSIFKQSQTWRGGGKGTILALAASVASRSTPANTVYKWSGVLELFNDILTAGRALAAAHPQTEFTTTRAVPNFDIADSTSSVDNNSLKPMVVNSLSLA